VDESGVGQGIGEVVVEGKSILDNVCLGVQDAMREMVEEASGAAMFHAFVGGLEAGHETILDGGGGGGVALRGGQKHQGNIEEP
jgi:ABC-type multidrug transport system fused ATPase/permease subunit